MKGSSVQTIQRTKAEIDPRAGDGVIHRTPWQAAIPMATVFVSSACIMVLELVAGRIVSRYLGQSLYTWTSIIGVVLAGISIGNYLGGRLADRYPGRGVIAAQFFTAAALCLSVLAVNAWIGPVVAGAHLSWPARIFLHVTCVFLIPAAALGTISPVIARRALDCGGAPGRTVGSIYAWATAGSILGTFATGYFLLMWLGATAVVVAASASLGMIGALYGASVLLFRGRATTGPVATEGPAPLDPATESPSPSSDAWLMPVAAIAVASVCVMVIEVAAGRIISHQYGQSLYAWTAVIGAVLAGMSIGSYRGGRWADRFSPQRTLSWLFLLGALSTESILVLSRFFSNQILLIGLSWPAQISIHVFCAFFLPSLILGAVSPVAVKAALRDPRTAGRTIGSLYAWGSATSILGTFLAGFLLIAVLGIVLVVHMVAIVLALTAIAFQHRSKAPYISAALCIAALAIGVAPFPAVENIGRKVGLRDSPPPGTVYATESQYSYIAITQDEEQPNIREMVLDRLIHSRVNLENPRELRYEYEWVYTAVLDKYYPEGKPIDALVIGGGGYTYPHYLEVTRPGSRIDVAEIDPAVTEAAFAAFGLPRDTSIRPFNMDARNFVDDALSAEPLRGYDCILGDSINDYSVPYHLTTFEFNEKLGRLLKDDGIYLLNLIDLFNSGRFLGAVVNTCRRTFPHVYVFNSRNNPNRRDTFVVVNAKRALDLTAVTDKVRALYGCQGELLDESALAQLHVNAGDSVLTDDFAPVDIMLAPVARTSRETYPAHLIANANKMIAEGRFDDAIVVCRLVLRSGISTAEARQLLAKALWHNQKYDQAWEQVHQLQADGELVEPDFLESLRRDSGRNE